MINLIKVLETAIKLNKHNFGTAKQLFWDKTLLFLEEKSKNLKPKKLF